MQPSAEVWRSLCFRAVDGGRPNGIVVAQLSDHPIIAVAPDRQAAPVSSNTAAARILVGLSSAGDWWLMPSKSNGRRAVVRGVPLMKGKHRQPDRKEENSHDPGSQHLTDRLT
jgi:hypothetical protein